MIFEHQFPTARVHIQKCHARRKQSQIHCQLRRDLTQFLNQGEQSRRHRLQSGCGFRKFNHSGASSNDANRAVGRKVQRVPPRFRTDMTILAAEDPIGLRAIHPATENLRGRMLNRKLAKLAFHFLHHTACLFQCFLRRAARRCGSQTLEENCQPLVEFHPSSAYFVSVSARLRISFTFHGRPSVFVTLLMRGSQ